MKRHWQVELAQAKRRVRVLEYLLKRAERPQPRPVKLPRKVTLMDRVESALKFSSPMSVRDVAMVTRIEEKSVRHAMKSLAEVGRVQNQGRGRWFALLLAAMLLPGCVTTSNVQRPTSNAQPSAVTAAPMLPTLQTLNVAQSSVAPVKTNGVVTLKWNNGEPAETVIVNQTTGTVYPATTAETLTVGGLAIGSQQTFVATNTSGSSLPASVVVTPDTMRLSYQTWLYLTWPGPAGVLQAATNVTQPGTVWRDVQPIASGGSFIVTNQSAREFFRVRY